MNKTRILIYCGILGIGIACIVFYVNDATVTVNTKDVYRLSARDLSRLERRVELQKDGDAALEIALYYERSRNDIDTAILWRQKAAILGNKSAQAWIKKFEELKNE